MIEGLVQVIDLLRVIKSKNMGTPIAAVSAPTGSCLGAAIVLAIVSAMTSKLPPSKTDPGMTSR